MAHTRRYNPGRETVPLQGILVVCRFTGERGGSKKHLLSRKRFNHLEQGIWKAGIFHAISQFKRLISHGIKVSTASRGLQSRVEWYQQALLVELYIESAIIDDIKSLPILGYRFHGMQRN